MPTEVTFVTAFPLTSFYFLIADVFTDNTFQKLFLKNLGSLYAQSVKRFVY